jgi:hypothetical protein
MSVETIVGPTVDTEGLPRDYDILRTVAFTRKVFSYLPDSCAPCYVGRLRYIYENTAGWLIQNLVEVEAVDLVLKDNGCNHSINDDENLDIVSKLPYVPPRIMPPPIVRQRVVDVELP